MDSDERDICTYLKLWPNQSIAALDISRHAAGKRRFREDPQWATMALERLVEKGIIEANGLEGYHLCNPTELPAEHRKWISPQIRTILEQSGKDFSHLFNGVTAHTASAQQSQCG